MQCSQVDQQIKEVSSRISKFEPLLPTTNQRNTKDKQIRWHLEYRRKTYKNREKNYQRSINDAYKMMDVQKWIALMYQAAVEYVWSMLAYIKWVEIWKDNKLFNRREYYYQEKKKIIPKTEQVLSDNNSEKIELAWKHLVYCNTNKVKPDYQKALHL